MPNRQGNDDRSDAGEDREWQRDVASDSSRGGQGAGGRRSNRGFASMDRGKQREIASKGGKAAHAKGTAHEFDSDEAREAGRKGGQAVSRNRDHMAMIGRRGGEARGHSRTRNPDETNDQGENGGAEGGSQNTRGVISDREVGLRGSSAGQGNGTGANNASTNGVTVSASTQTNRGGTSSLGGETRSPTPGAAERSTNH